MSEYAPTKRRQRPTRDDDPAAIWKRIAETNERMWLAERARADELEAQLAKAREPEVTP